MATPAYEVIGPAPMQPGPEFDALVMSLVPRVLPEAIARIHHTRRLYAELMAIRAKKAQTAEGPTSA